MQVLNKEYLRSLLAGEDGFQVPAGLQPGKLAQQLRGEPFYRKAAVIFVSPSPLLHQIRINALLDGKKMIMPSPGLRDGFVLYRPFSLSFRDIGYAVTLRGQKKYGECIAGNCLNDLRVDFLITDAWAIDLDGNRLGDGQGFFDLAYALLGDSGALSEKQFVLAVAACEQLLEEKLVSDPWDVSMDAALTDTGIRNFSHACRGAGVIWDQLSRKRIKKITPLWQLYCKRMDG